MRFNKIKMFSFFVLVFNIHHIPIILNVLLEFLFKFYIKENI